MKKGGYLKFIGAATQLENNYFISEFEIYFTKKHLHIQSSLNVVKHYLLGFRRTS